MRQAQSIAVAIALSAASAFVTAQVQPAPAPAPPAGGRGDGGGLVQVVYNLQGVPPGTHGVHIHTVGRCEGDFASAGGHFDPGPAGNADPDLNHPYHSGDLPNIVANATGAVTATSYTTRINLGGPLSPIDADGAAIVIHQNPDTNQTGTKGQGVGGGTAIACGVIVK